MAQELRDDLLHLMSRRMRNVARGAQVDGRPIEAALALPRQRDHEGLIEAASVVHAMAKRYEAKLVAVGLSKELLDEVLTVSAALKTAKDARAQDYINRAHAAAQSQPEVRKAGDVLRFTNALMRKRVRGNPALWKAWEQARRMGWGSSAVEAPVIGEGEVGRAA